MRAWMVAVLGLGFAGCPAKEAKESPPPPPSPSPSPSPAIVAPAAPPSKYLDSSGRDDELSGGSRFIPITTKAGTFKVWVKRTGNHPRIKVLLLHGGPGATHEYFQAFDSYFPKAEVE